MKYHELQASNRKDARRVGRGIAAGRGKTAGRGTKGQNARKSGGVRPGFEGGQNPLMQRLPKLPGFRSPRVKPEAVYTGDINQLSTVDNFSLHKAGLVSSPYVRVKLISKGDITNKLTVKLQGASQSAIEAIQKAGGSFTKVDQVKRPSKTPADR